MKKSYLFSIIAFLIAITIITVWSGNEPQQRKEIRERKDDAIGRQLQLYKMLRDPVTNKIPSDVRESERKFLERVPKRDALVLSKTGSTKNVQALNWTERGPNNVGGRVRGMDLDVRTTGSSTIIIAGGVSGGIWKSTNDGTVWVEKSAKSQLHSVTCVVQDKRSGKNDIWYVGSGEKIANSADGGGNASFLGDGVFKSTDNGETWTLLTSTSGGSPNNLTSDWQYVFNLAVDPTNSTEDEIYAANAGGIYRSTDGGVNWTSVHGVTNNYRNTDVAVSPSTGYVIATISDGEPTSGLWKSTDGTTFTDKTPASFPTTYNRIVVAIAPGNENYVYAFVQGSDNTPNQNNHQLWVSTDKGETWTNRSSNLPTGTLVDTQGGYDMLLAVKPDDENFVLLGGVVLWRSTDGFATSSNTTRVGGLGTDTWDSNKFGDYIKHHPDQHLARFHHNDSKKCYVANDGGVHITTDITALGTNPNPIVWDYKRQTHNVTQFYAISIAPDANDPYIAGGAQDRGNFSTRTAGLQDWYINSGGDGATCEVAPDADNAVYLSTSEGKLDRYTKTPDQDFQTSVSIQPTGLQNPMFVNPILLDPVDSRYIYYAGGNAPSQSGVWRNDDATNATPSNWTYLTSTTITSTAQVSAFGMSMSDNSVLYYGTDGGNLYKLDNPNTGSSPTKTDITGASFPSGAYVSGIAVDPSDKNKVMVVFSNYNVAKIWYSTDGGGNWTNVDGNFAGGSGPSVRHAAMFTLSGVTHYFLATSVGVYYTLILNGSSTVWTQEATSTIGNVVCTMLDWRVDTGTLPKISDGSSISSTNAVNVVTLAVATHGRGVFSTQIDNPLPVELISFTGIYNLGSVKLNWQTATEVNNYGFEIERKKSNNGNWENIGFVSGHGNSNSPKTYSFVDGDLNGSEKLFYRLKQIDIDGKFEYSNVVEVVIVIGDYKLSQNYPNPFNPSTKIDYTIPETADVIVEVYSITGELVTQLVNLRQNAGNYSVEFNAIGNSNLSSGMYIYRISAKGVSGNIFIQAKKMLLLK